MIRIVGRMVGNVVEHNFVYNSAHHADSMLGILSIVVFSCKLPESQVGLICGSDLFFM